ncbi:HotDog domain-containing protein [Sphaerosporella brunnea]|uniref:HotDog domain-containing protein n=1 Tax=Sphaerosporella brunnea TaxID=1250544 RepID=A0A5J5EQ72_9PEZI|nr:HotDog domain-containing protein [Sphaerosporella brunnea]
MTVTTTEPDFASLPWVQTILAAPSTTLVETDFIRQRKASSEDSLTAVTLNTADTFRALLGVRTPAGTILFVSLGDGMNGHPGVLHGGIVATIMDMALCIAIDESVPAFTAWLKLGYKKPTPAPGVLMAKCWVARKEGRKWFINGSLENGSGTVYAEAECLYVEVKQAML